MRVALAAAIAVAAVAFSASAALAQDVTSTAVDTERFRPVPDPSAGVLLSGAGFGEPWELDFAVWLHVSRNPIVLTAPDGEGRGAALIEGRIGTRLQVGWNIGRRVRLAADLPLTLYQVGIHPISGESLPLGGVGDLRIEPRVTLLDPDTKPVGIALAAPISFPTGREDALLGDPGPTIQPRATIEGRPPAATRIATFAIAGDFGWRFRPRSEIAGLDTAGEFTFAAGARWMPLDRLRIGTEVAGAIGTGPNGRNAEWVTWAKGSFGAKQRVEVVGGVALGLGPGVGTPEGRVFLAVRTRIRPGGPKAGAELVADAADAGASEEAPTTVRGPSPVPLPGVTNAAGWGLRLVERRARIRSKVLFALDSARLTDAGKQSLSVLGDWLVGHPSVRRLEVAGHADERGTHAYNDPLSLRRAKAVVSYLMGMGVSSARLTVKAYGERKPTAEGGWDADRRVEFMILDGSDPGLAEVAGQAAGRTGQRTSNSSKGTSRPR